MSEVEDTKPSVKEESADMANGGEKKELDFTLDVEPSDWSSLGDTDFSKPTNDRGSYRGGRGSFRGSRGIRGPGYRGRGPSGRIMNLRYLDAKAMYLIFEKPINTVTAKEVMGFGQDANSVGFGRGCTLHFKDAEEAKEIMEKVKEMKFGGLETSVEYAYKKRSSESEKRPSNVDKEEEEEEEEEEEQTSPVKKPKIDGETEEKGEGEGEALEGEEGGEEAEGEYAEEGAEGEYYNAEGQDEEGESQEGQEEEFEEPGEQNEDDVDDDENS